MIIKIIYGIFFIVCGGALLKYRRVVKSWTGNFVWAEQYLGRGGTYTIIILFGLFMMFLGVTYPFGGFSILLEGLKK